MRNMVKGRGDSGEYLAGAMVQGFQQIMEALDQGVECGVLVLQAVRCRECGGMHLTVSRLIGRRLDVRSDALEFLGKGCAELMKGEVGGGRH